MAGGAGAADDVVWLGHITEDVLYRFAAPGGGLDLRDNPNLLYRAAGSEEAADWTHYSFKVVPYVGLLAANRDEVRGTIVTLDNRTTHLSEAPRHPQAALPGFAGNEAGVRLDAGTLVLGTTDLAVASFGPPAALERVYRSDVATSAYFAPGWRFSFERSLDVSSPATAVSYFDLAGDQWRFLPAGSLWSGPYGTAAPGSSTRAPSSGACTART